MTEDIWKRVLKTWHTKTITALLAVITGMLLSLFGSGLLIPLERGKEETTENRIRRLTASLQEAAQLIDNIESEITARSVLAENLQKDIETYNKLVELKKPEVEAVAQLLRGELKREGRRSFWTGFALNFLFFALGVTATIIIQKVVRGRTGT